VCISALMSSTLLGCSDSKKKGVTIWYTLQEHGDECIDTVGESISWTLDKAESKPVQACAYRVATEEGCAAPWFSLNARGECTCWTRPTMDCSVKKTSHGAFNYFRTANPVHGHWTQTEHEIEQCMSEGPCYGALSKVGNTRHCVHNPLRVPDDWAERHFDTWEHNTTCKCAGWLFDGQQFRRQQLARSVAAGGTRASPQAIVVAGQPVRHDNFFDHFDELREAIAKSAGSHPTGATRTGALSSTVSHFCPMMQSLDLNYHLSLLMNGVFSAAQVDDALRTHVTLGASHVDESADARSFRGAARSRLAMGLAVSFAVGLVICIATWRSRRANADRLLLSDSEGEQSCQELSALPHDAHSRPQMQA